MYKACKRCGYTQPKRDKSCHLCSCGIKPGECFLYLEFDDPGIDKCRKRVGFICADCSRMRLNIDERGEPIK